MFKIKVIGGECKGKSIISAAENGTYNEFEIQGLGSEVGCQEDWRLGR